SMIEHAGAQRYINARMIEAVGRYGERPRAGPEGPGRGRDRMERLGSGREPERASGNREAPARRQRIDERVTGRERDVRDRHVVTTAPDDRSQIDRGGDSDIGG